MVSYLLGRLVALVPVALVVAAVVFLLIHVTPGDPARVILGQDATAAQVAALRHELGLDRPLPVQFALWLWRAAHGDLGTSYFLRIPVAVDILDHAGPTTSLAFLSLVVALFIGVPTGILSAVLRNSWIDQFSLGLAMLGAAVPSFWLGLFLILLFAVNLGWLPSSGYRPPGHGMWESLHYLILPSLALGIPNSSLIIRLTRSSLLDVLGNDYIRTARAKGLPERIVILRHGFKNALVSVLTVVGLTFAGLMGGAVVTETVFSLPGLGQLVVLSVLRRDYPVIQGIVLTVATIYVIINLLVDLTYAAIDPRIRY